MERYWQPVFEYQGNQYEAKRQIKIANALIDRIHSEKKYKANLKGEYLELYLHSRLYELEKSKDDILSHFMTRQEVPKVRGRAKRVFRKVHLLYAEFEGSLNSMGKNFKNEAYDFWEKVDDKLSETKTPKKLLVNAIDIETEFMEFAEISKAKSTDTVGSFALRTFVLQKVGKEIEFDKDSRQYKSTVKNYGIKNFGVSGNTFYRKYYKIGLPNEEQKPYDYDQVESFFKNNPQAMIVLHNLKTKRRDNYIDKK